MWLFYGDGGLGLLVSNVASNYQFSFFLRWFILFFCILTCSLYFCILIGVPVRVINRPGSQLLGANGRDDGAVVSFMSIYCGLLDS